MPIYIKPNGNEIEINENSVPYALSIGWKPKEAEAFDWPDSDLEFLRKRYEELLGKKPHHKLKEAALLKAIEDGNSRTDS